MTGESFIDVDFCQQSKHGQYVCGDVFISRKIKEEGRVISVLADGLGSGVKASVLANLTATMALKYTAAFVDLRQSATTIMDTLPVCEVRKISYSTFTIVDIDADGAARIVEHGNPQIILLRGREEVPLTKHTLTIERWKDRLISYCELNLQLGDRLIYFSDGISQSGMGKSGMPLGWGVGSAAKLAKSLLTHSPDLSAGGIARELVGAAIANDGQSAKDDITCGVAYFRHPRRLLVVTGPPFSRERDAELARTIECFAGKKAICGGTTATIISRILNRPTNMILHDLDSEVPPASQMDGVDLITEGTLTLAKVADMLERPPGQIMRRNAAHALVDLMLESDIVEFLVGTRINDAHQDPNVPVELDLRRNIVRRLAAALESRHLKETRVRFL